MAKANLTFDFGTAIEYLEKKKQYGVSPGASLTILLTQLATKVTRFTSKSQTAAKKIPTTTLMNTKVLRKILQLPIGNKLKTHRFRNSLLVIRLRNSTSIPRTLFTYSTLKRKWMFGGNRLRTKVLKMRLTQIFLLNIVMKRRLTKKNKGG